MIHFSNLCRKSLSLKKSRPFWLRIWPEARFAFAKGQNVSTLSEKALDVGKWLFFNSFAGLLLASSISTVWVNLHFWRINIFAKRRLRSLKRQESGKMSRTLIVLWFLLKAAPGEIHNQCSRDPSASCFCTLDLAVYPFFIIKPLFGVIWIQLGSVRF